MDPTERERLRRMAAELLMLAGPCWHSLDFASVVWFGVPYRFTGGQAKVIGLLWQAWERATPEMFQETLLDAAGSVAKRLAHLFQGSPAWGTLVISGELKGTFRLADPPQEAKPQENRE